MKRNKEHINFTIKGTPLIKFQCAEKIEKLQKGELYAKTLKYYREREKETGDEDIGDEFEAMVHIHKGLARNVETGEVIEIDDALLETCDSNDYVFCMFGIYPSLQSFQFTETQKEKMLSFGNTALVVTDSDEFQRRVFAAARREGYDVHFGAAQYYDPSEDWVNMFTSLLKGMWNIAFWKRKKYSYQQEGRFVFIPMNDKDRDKDHITLDIGDISDISKIFPAKAVLTANVKAV